MSPVEDILSVPCFIFALRRESMHFRRAYPLLRRFPGAPCRAQFRRKKRCQEPFSEKTAPDTFFRSVLMLETGVGAAAMERALRWCLSKPRFGEVLYRPSLLVSAGFSGALQPEQRVGDLVLATEVVDQYGNRWPAIHPDGLSGCDIVEGRLITMPKLVGDPKEKWRLGQQSGAIAVDMESAVAARLCHEHNVPFACLRVISDDWQTTLSPHLVELLRQGRVSIPSLARRVLSHPKLIGELWRLGGQTRRASRNLLEPLSALLWSGRRIRDGWLAG